MTRMGGGDILGASPRNLWSALSLSRINAMLSKPLSEEDVRFNQVNDNSVVTGQKTFCALTDSLCSAAHVL